MRKVSTDANGVARFERNRVVRFLLDEASNGRECDLNRLWYELDHGTFSRAELREFYQLIGFSVSGYAEAFCRTAGDRKSVERAAKNDPRARR